MSRCTFGKAPRGALLTNDGPAPNKYRPVQFTEASLTYTFPKAVSQMDTLKEGSKVGPGEYKNMIGIADLAECKSEIPRFGKASRSDPSMKDNGFPGPDSYNVAGKHHIPGFRIFKPGTHTRRVENKTKVVGP